LVAWNWAERIDQFPVGREIDALIAPRTSEWNGNVKVEATLLDMRPCE
jgi:hypothetical protein